LPLLKGPFFRLNGGLDAFQTAKHVAAYHFIDREWRREFAIIGKLLIALQFNGPAVLIGDAGPGLPGQGTQRRSRRRRRMGWIRCGGCRRRLQVGQNHYGRGKRNRIGRLVDGAMGRRKTDAVRSVAPFSGAELQPVSAHASRRWLRVQHVVSRERPLLQQSQLRRGFGGSRRIYWWPYVTNEQEPKIPAMIITFQGEGVRGESQHTHVVSSLCVTEFELLPPSISRHNSFTRREFCNEQ
jgi:hypothetical protein